jgi:peptide/nickel transport system substrate-binding protein
MPSTKKWRLHLPGTQALREGLASLSFLERALLWILLAVLAGSTLAMLLSIRAAFLQSIPASGGHLTEGVLGTPRFINPVIARSNTDKDLAALLYSGLMRPAPNGTLIPDLAEGYTVSEDGTLYTFTIKENALFHDGKKVSADDVVYTIGTIQNPLLGSPFIRAWEGVTVRAEDSRTVTFKLPKPYAHFIDNTTVGILPHHLWAEANEETFSMLRFNSEPVGSGPFMLDRIERDDSGVPTAYVLTRFSDFVLGEPYLDRITLRMYGNERDLMRAFNKGTVDAMHNLDPIDVQGSIFATEHVLHYPLPRVFALFFNQNHNELFAEATVREALSIAVDPAQVVEEVLYGYGTPLSGPLPPPISYETDDTVHTIDAARKLLEADGWTRGDDGIYAKGKQRLSFTITTASTPELKDTAEVLARTYQTLGADVSVEVFDLGVLHQDVIRPRSYDALLFGQVVGRSGDLFPFWHSSQRNDPGLNTSLYTNREVDDMLSDIRTTLEVSKKRELYASLGSVIRADHPAVFLYAPHFVYVVPETLKGITSGPIDEGYERFMDAHTWHFGTRNVVTKFE